MILELDVERYHANWENSLSHAVKIVSLKAKNMKSILFVNNLIKIEGPDLEILYSSI